VNRVPRLVERLELPLLVTAPANVRYLTDFRSSNAALLVDRDAETTLYADFRYAAAGRAVEGVAFVESPRDLMAALAEVLSGRRIAFEELHLSYGGYRTLQEGGVDLTPTVGIVEGLRAVKDDVEIDAIRSAAALSDEIFAALVAERFTGRSELELAWWIERSFRNAGAEGVSFAPIVAAGNTAGVPHAVPGDRTVEADVLVVVDAGCTVDGYCSDCTRTFSTGSPPSRLVEAYSVCLEAQLAGLSAVRPGVSGRDLDTAARELIGRAGFGSAFGHGLGHGVGLEVHEAPSARPESKDVMQPGNTLTVEPGIYLPGEGGIRIEDLVLVTPEGCERLTKFPKELTSVA
jgi:Xaa-Pro aminopeptidase